MFIQPVSFSNVSVPQSNRNVHFQGKYYGIEDSLDDYDRKYGQPASAKDVAREAKTRKAHAHIMNGEWTEAFTTKGEIMIDCIKDKEYKNAAKLAKSMVKIARKMF